MELLNILNLMDENEYVAIVCGDTYNIHQVKDAKKINHIDSFFVKQIAVEEAEIFYLALYI